MPVPPQLPNTGPLASLGEAEKKQRLDAMVKIWQSDTQRRLEREGYRAFTTAMGLHEYRYAAWLRFPEWERSAVVGQLLTLRPGESGAPEDPALFSAWRHEPLLKTMPDWKIHLPNESAFTIGVLLTPGGLGEGSKWAVMMPKELIPRYKPGWPTQRDWVQWTNQFDWLSVGVAFVRLYLAQ